MSDDDDDLFSYRAKGGGEGGARRGDPKTSKGAARTLKTEGLMWQVLLSMRHGQPRNGWEIAVAMGMETQKDTVVPRLAPLRRQHAILNVTPNRPGPTGHGQLAYVITDKGRAILRHEIELVINPPLELWERRDVMQEWLWQALQHGWTDELKQKVAAGFATYIPDAEDDEE